MTRDFETRDAGLFFVSRLAVTQSRVCIKTLQKYSIVPCRAENVSKKGLLWRNPAICGEIRPFLWRKSSNETKKDAKIRVSVVNFVLLFTSRPCLAERLVRRCRLGGPFVPTPSYRNGKSHRPRCCGYCICSWRLTAHTDYCLNAQIGSC